MFINFWYPAELTRELGTDPVKCRILGQNLVLFRDAEGQAHCLSNVCVHRCASLANGWVTGNRVACPYHGWEYNGDGICEKIPSVSNREATRMPRARVDAYPTQERYGIVFVFLGDLPEDERPPVMEIPEWDQPGWRSTLTSYQWSANYRRVVENALDFAHPEFVHLVGRRGEDPDWTVPDYDIVESEWGAGAQVSFRRQASGFWRFFRDDGGESTAGTTFHGPAQFVTRIHIDKQMSNYQYVFEAPVDEYTIRSFLVSSRNFFTAPFLDKLADRRNRAIIEEDRVIAENIEPVIGREGPTTDLSVEADKIQMVYRRKLKEWEARGWRIDTEALARAYPGKDFWVLPSPARRTAGNWVFNTVPLIGTETAAGPVRKAAG